MAEKELICPNCGPGTKCHAKDGGGLVCEACGGTFTWTAGEPTLTDVGELERLKGDVEQLKNDHRRVVAELARKGRLEPTADPDGEMPDRDPDEIIVDPDDEEDL